MKARRRTERGLYSALFKTTPEAEEARESYVDFDTGGSIENRRGYSSPMRNRVKAPSRRQILENIYPCDVQLRDSWPVFVVSLSKGAKRRTWLRITFAQTAAS